MAPLPVIIIQRIHPDAKLPVRKHLSAGYDLYTPEDVTIPAGEMRCIKLGFKMSGMHELMYAQLKSRSGLTIKKGLDGRAGVIDWDYRGEVILALKNESAEDRILKAGESCGQMLFLPILTPEITEGEVENDTERGEGGFGSTGH